MRKPLALAVAAALSITAVDGALAQPGYYGHRSPPPPPGYAPMAPGPYAGQHYYNGRWIGEDEWRRHAYERDRWTRDYRRRHRDKDSDAALVAGIIGFALGAAIVGSQADAERAHRADRSFDAYCARTYRHYDPRSRTYLGPDGFRHYCR